MKNVTCRADSLPLIWLSYHEISSSVECNERGQDRSKANYQVLQLFISTS